MTATRRGSESVSQESSSPKSEGDTSNLAASTQTGLSLSQLAVDTRRLKSGDTEGIETNTADLLFCPVVAGWEKSGPYTRMLLHNLDEVFTDKASVSAILERLDSVIDKFELKYDRKTKSWYELSSTGVPERFVWDDYVKHTMDTIASLAKSHPLTENKTTGLMSMEDARRLSPQIRDYEVKGRNIAPMCKTSCSSSPRALGLSRLWAPRRGSRLSLMP